MGNNLIKTKTKMLYIKCLIQLKNINKQQWLKDNALYNMGLKDGEYQREPRWPIEMQVLSDKVRHIDTAFPTPEPFYARSIIKPNRQFLISSPKNSFL